MVQIFAMKYRTENNFADIYPFSHACILLRIYIHNFLEILFIHLIKFSKTDTIGLDILSSYTIKLYLQVYKSNLVCWFSSLSLRGNKDYFQFIFCSLYLIFFSKFIWIKCLSKILCEYIGLPKNFQSQTSEKKSVKLTCLVKFLLVFKLICQMSG